MKLVGSFVILAMLVAQVGTELQALEADSQSFHLVPYPRQVQRLAGSFAFEGARIALQCNTEDRQGLVFAAEQLADEIERDLRLNVKGSQSDSEGRITLALPPFQPVTQAALKEAGLAVDAELLQEGYVLLVQLNRVLVAANEAAGIYYGVQTLKQLIRAHARDLSVPCVAIRDWPVLGWRGILDDISRGPIPTMAFFKECIRRFSELKINALTYYTENVVRTEKHGFFSPRDALTLEQIAELVAYADRHHIDLIGSFQSFSHFERILEYPQYEHLGEMGSLLTPAKEESYRLLADVYAELAQVYRSKLFAVYGDEVWALGKGASEKLVQEQGKAAVYASHINRLHDELQKHGKQILVTADVMLEHPKILDMLKENMILLPWDYSPRESFLDMIVPLQQKGFETIVTPGVSCWRRVFPNFEGTVGNLRNFIRDGVQQKAMGALITTWDDWGSNFFSNNWYGVAFGADQAWHSENPETETFDRRLATGFYGDSTGAVSRAIRGLSSLVEIPPMQGLETTVFWQRLVPAFGVPAGLSMTHWDEVKTRGADAGAFVEKSAASHYDEDLKYIRYAADQVVFMADVRQDLLAAATAYRQACLSQKDTSECEAHLNEALAKIAGIAARWQVLHDRYRALWLAENRPHGLEINTIKFQQVERDLADVEARLRAAKADYEDGFFLPPPVRVRLDIRELADNFFRTWLLAGSFPNPKRDRSQSSHAPGNCLGFQTDYLTEFGGEANVRPKEGDRVTRPDGKELIWQLQTTNLGAKFDLAGLFEENQRTVVYAYCTIESPSDQTVRAAFGSNDGIKVFLNGEQLFETHALRFVKIDEDKVDLPLRQGLNHLVLKIDQGRGKWGFAFRLPDVDVTNLGYAYSIAE